MASYVYHRGKALSSFTLERETATVHSQVVVIGEHRREQHHLTAKGGKMMLTAGLKFNLKVQASSTEVLQSLTMGEFE